MVLHHIKGIEWFGIWFDLYQEMESKKYYLLVQQYGETDNVVIVEVQPSEFDLKVTKAAKGGSMNGAPNDGKAEN